MSALEEQGKRVAASPWGPDDQIGALNRITPASRAAIMARIDGREVYDLSVDFFLGMPSFQAAGDPPFQMWMTHTPQGTLVDDLNGQGPVVNTCAAYSGDVILMYTHTGTHIDSLNHLGYHGEIYNGVKPEDALGSRHWLRNGSEQMPPIIARGVLIDVPAHLGVECLPDSHAIGVEEIEATLAAQGVELREGDVALIRTGRMRHWPDSERVMGDSPGVSIEAAEWLTEVGIAAVGADNEAVEVTPSRTDQNWLPGHCHFLAGAGVPMMELLNLEEISQARLYEHAFVGAPIRIRGATGSPLRPLAFPVR